MDRNGKIIVYINVYCRKIIIILLYCFQFLRKKNVIFYHIKPTIISANIKRNQVKN